MLWIRPLCKSQNPTHVIWGDSEAGSCMKNKLNHQRFCRPLSSALAQPLPAPHRSLCTSCVAGLGNGWGSGCITCWDGSRSLGLKSVLRGRFNHHVSCSETCELSTQEATEGPHSPRPPAELPAWAEGWGWGSWGRDQAFALIRKRQHTDGGTLSPTSAHDPPAGVGWVGGAYGRLCFS